MQLTRISRSKKPKKVNYSDFMHIIPRVGNLGYNYVSKTSDNNQE